jgi:aryl-alcohol dehydrogenase-like predicted oxidoreductase
LLFPLLLPDTCCALAAMESQGIPFLPWSYWAKGTFSQKGLADAFQQAVG